jgi:hypothetical protein
MSDLQQLIQQGKDLGYDGQELQTFVSEQQKADRDARAAERELEKLRLEDAERQREEAERQREEAEKERRHAVEMETLRLADAEKEREKSRQVEDAKLKLESDKLKLESEKEEERKNSGIAKSKLPPFDDSKDKFDAYINRFESYAILRKWKKAEWSVQLSILLSGKALDTYYGLNEEDQKNYDQVKDALMRRFELTEDEFRKQFFSAKADQGESPTQFMVRLERILARWIQSAKINKTFVGLCSLLVQEQFIRKCHTDLAAFLREKKKETTGELAKTAELYIDAHGGSIYEPRGSKRKVKAQDSGSKTDSSKTESSSSDVCKYCKQAGHGVDECEKLKKRKERICFVCGDPAHIASACPNKKVTAAALSKPVTNNLKVACMNHGVPVESGIVNGKKVDIMRDKGCTLIVVKQNLVKPCQYLGNHVECVLADGTCVKCPTAKINVQTTYVSGEIEAAVMKSPIFDLIIGNVEGVVGHSGLSPKETNCESELSEKRTNCESELSVKRTNCESGLSVKRTNCESGESVGSNGDMKCESPGCEPHDHESHDCESHDCESTQNEFIDMITDESKVNQIAVVSEKHSGSMKESMPYVGNVNLFDTNSNVDMNLNDIESDILGVDISGIVPYPVWSKGDDCDVYKMPVSNAVHHDNSVGVTAVLTRAQARRTKLSPLIVPQQEVFNSEELSKLQHDDETLQPYWDYASKGVSKETKNAMVSFSVKNGILLRVFELKDGTEKIKQVMVPVSCRKKVLTLAHDGLMSGHLGIKRTQNRVLSNFYWPGVNKDVTYYCRSCDICQKTVDRGRLKKAPLGDMPIIKVPFERVAVDLIGPVVSSSRGHRYILTVVDFASRYPEAIALKKIDVISVAEALVEIFCRVGFPREVLSDRGAQFISDMMKEVSRLLSVKQIFTTPYNPRCNGMVERFNGSLKKILRRLCAESPKEWDRYLPAVLFAYRTSVQESTGFTPFEIVTGRKARGPLDILKAYWSKDDEEEARTVYQYVLDLRQRLEQTCRLAEEESKTAQRRNKKYYDKKTGRKKIKVGSKVLILLPTKSNKLLLQWRGPFEVIEQKSPVNYVVKVKGREKNFHVNNLKPYIERNAVLSIIINDGDVIDDNEMVDVCPVHSSGDLKNVAINEELSSEQKAELQGLLEKYQDVFTDQPGMTDIETHSITLTSQNLSE